MFLGISCFSSGIFPIFSSRFGFYSGFLSFFIDFLGFSGLAFLVKEPGL